MQQNYGVRWSGPEFLDLRQYGTHHEGYTQHLNWDKPTMIVFNVVGLLQRTLLAINPAALRG